MFRPKMGAQTHQQKKKNFIRKCIKMCGKSSTKSKKWKSLRAFQIHFHVDTELYLGSSTKYTLCMRVWFYLCGTRAQSAKWQSQSVNERAMDRANNNSERVRESDDKKVFSLH